MGHVIKINALADMQESAKQLVHFALLAAILAILLTLVLAFPVQLDLFKLKEDSAKFAFLHASFAKVVHIVKNVERGTGSSVISAIKIANIRVSIALYTMAIFALLAIRAIS
jgi:hypothetical protein